MNQIIVEIETAKAAVELPSPVRRHGRSSCSPTGRHGRRRDADHRDRHRCGRGTHGAGRCAAGGQAGARGAGGDRRGRVADTWSGTAPAPAGRPAPAPSRGGTGPPDAPAAPSHPHAADHPPSRTARSSRATRSGGRRVQRRRPPCVSRWPSRRCASSPRSSGVDLRDGQRHRTGRRDHPRGRRGLAAAPAAAPAGRRPRVGERREPIRGVRKATAAAMVASAFTAPHVTEFLTVDVTAMMALRDRLRASAGVRRREADPAGLRRQGGLPGRPPHPGGQLELGRGRRGDRLPRPRAPRHRGRHAARAGRAEDPRRRRADPARAGRRAGRADRDRPGRQDATPADLVGGTFTITNVGVFGVDTGTPIINPGEAAILAARRDQAGAVGGRRRARGAHGVPARAVVRPPAGRRRAGLAVPGRRRRAAGRPRARRDRTRTRINREQKRPIGR